VAAGPVEAEGGAPIVDDQGDAVAELELSEQTVQILAVLNEAVGVGSGVVELV